VKELKFVSLIYYAFATRQCRRMHYILGTVRPPPSFIRSSGQILLPWYLVNSLSNLDETYREYSLAPTDDRIRFWKSEVNVTAGRRGGEGTYVDAWVPKSIYSFQAWNNAYDAKIYYWSTCNQLGLQWRCKLQPQSFVACANIWRLLFWCINTHFKLVH